MLIRLIWISEGLAAISKKSNVVSAQEFKMQMMQNKIINFLFSKSQSFYFPASVFPCMSLSGRSCGGSSWWTVINVMTQHQAVCYNSLSLLEKHVYYSLQEKLLHLASGVHS